MSQPCGVPKCDRRSRAPCDCCQKDLCLQHLNEHNALLIGDFNPLIDQINELNNRLKSININELLHNNRQKLEDWKQRCYEQINRLFKKKSKELEEIFTKELDEQKRDAHDIQLKIDKFVRQQEATREDIDSLKTRIRQLQQQINSIEHKSYQINTRPLFINNSCIRIRRINQHPFDLSTFPLVYRSLTSLPDSDTALASNDQYLLIHQNPNLCFIDRDCKIIKEVPWKHKSIYDMCWSSTLDRFIIIDDDSVFVVDENTMSVEMIETIGKTNWLSCTCSDTSLFLTTNAWGSSILELQLLPSMSVIREWKSPLTCTANEFISSIAYSSGTCAIVIKNKIEKSMRMELRSCESMNCIWSFPFNITLIENFAFHCCSVNRDEWLLLDYQSKCLLHITTDGKLKITIPYNEKPCAATQFGEDMLVISTNQGQKFHKIAIEH